MRGLFIYILLFGFVYGQEISYQGKWQLEAKVSFDVVNSNLLFWDELFFEGQEVTGLRVGVIPRLHYHITSKDVIGAGFGGKKGYFKNESISFRSDYEQWNTELFYRRYFPIAPKQINLFLEWNNAWVYASYQVQQNETIQNQSREFWLSSFNFGVDFPIAKRWHLGFLFSDLVYFNSDTQKIETDFRFYQKPVFTFRYAL